MIDDKKEQYSFFDCSSEIENLTNEDITNYNSSDFIIIGIPYDGFTTQSLGVTSNAPNTIRKISYDLSIMSESHHNITKLKMVDIGDIKLGKLKELKLNKDLIPIFLGGNHAITLDCYKVVNELHKPKEVIMISFDAHLDFYDDWFGVKKTHCTVMKRINEIVRDNMVVIGARDIDLPEYEEADKVDLKYLTMKELYDAKIKENIPIQKKFEKFISDTFQLDFSNKDKDKKKEIYISIDLDVFDPSIAPATGYPIPGGLDYRTMIYFLEFLTANFKVVGADFVEYAPNLDIPSKITGFLMAKLISEFIVMLEKQK